MTDPDFTPVDDLIDEDAPIDPDTVLAPEKPFEDMTPAERRRLWAEWKRERERREGELEAVVAQMQRLQDFIVADFIEAEEQSARLADGRLVHLKHRTTASKRDDVSIAQFHGALAAAGLDYLIKPSVNSTSLASAVKQLKKDNKLPENFEDFVNVGSIVTVGVRKR